MMRLKTALTILGRGYMWLFERCRFNSPIAICLVLLGALLFTPRAFAQMQSRERVKLEWTSQFELPWFIPKQTMCGVDGAKRMRELCEESKDQLGSMAERLVGEYLNAAQKYCDQFDRQYIASFDGQICVYSETYYARVPPGFDDPATDENEDNESLDCEGIQNFIEFSLHQASMSANKVVWEFLDGVGRFDICKVVVDVDCELFDARPPVRISDPVA